MAQQCVEKCIKAVLAFKGAEVPRIHDLVELAACARDAGIDPPVGADELDMLTQYSVTLRYDDTEMETLSLDDAEKMVNLIIEWANRLTGGK